MVSSVKSLHQGALLIQYIPYHTSVCCFFHHCIKIQGAPFCPTVVFVRGGLTNPDWQADRGGRMLLARGRTGVWLFQGLLWSLLECLHSWSSHYVRFLKHHQVSQKKQKHSSSYKKKFFYLRKIRLCYKNSCICSNTACYTALCYYLQTKRQTMTYFRGRGDRLKYIMW